jgi:ligand-binding sensor domain-containing protein
MKHIKILLLVYSFLGLIIIPNKTFSQNQKWIYINQTNSILPSHTIYDLKIDKENVVWIATAKGLLSYENNKLFLFDTSNSLLPENKIQSIYIDEKNNKWIGTFTKGYARFNGKDWTIFDTSNTGIPSNSISAIILDPYGILWIGTDGNGLARFDGLVWTKFERGNSLIPGNRIYSLNHDGAKLWVSFLYESVWDGRNHDYCLGSFDGKNWTTYTDTNSLIPYQSSVYTIFNDDNKKLWFPTHQDCIIYDNGKWYSLAKMTGIEDDYFIDVGKDRNGNYWIASGTNRSNHGFYKYDGKNITTYYPPENNILNVSVDKFNNVWLVSYSEGIFIYNENGIVLDTKDDYLFPNPTYEYIELPADLIDNTNIKIYSLIGEVIYNGPFAYRIDVSSFALGMYFLKAGDKLYKFVKI